MTSRIHNLSPSQAKLREAGSAQGLYTEQMRAWGQRVAATFEERWVQTPKGWVLRQRNEKPRTP